MKLTKDNNVNKRNKNGTTNPKTQNICNNLDTGTHIKQKLFKERRNDRQQKNNNNAYNELKMNPTSPSPKHTNICALNRLFEYTKYSDMNELLKDKDNYEETIIKLASLYVAKNSSRQGTEDEMTQLDNINKLQEYNIIIEKDGKSKPVRTGGVRYGGKKCTDELKTIDFVVKQNTMTVGFIMAKVLVGSGGHQDNVMNEIIQFCDWANIELNNGSEKAYIVLFDCTEECRIFKDIKEKYNSCNLIMTNTDCFRADFLNWFEKKNL